MDEKARRRMHLECLFDMFRDRIEEDVVYFVYTENEGKIQQTIDQLMCIAACSLTGYEFEPTSSKSEAKKSSSLEHSATATTRNLSSCSRKGSPNQGRLNKRDLQSNGCAPRSATTNGLGSNGNSTKSDYDGSDRGDHDESENGGDEQLSLDERIARAQNSIEQLLSEKASCHEKASHYINKKMYPVTSYYSDLSSRCRKKIEDNTKKLIELLLEKSQNANTIDLHGLNPIQAKLVVSELLNIRQDQLSIDKQGETNIDIITGWGKHTVATGQHRIRSTILALLREKKFQYEHLNKGAFRVTIRR